MPHGESRSSAMKLPPISHPERYTGLYVYQFPCGGVFPDGHVSVGYTAAEIRILRESEAHRGGTAYEIYRVSDHGGMELRGVLDERLGAWEAICFLRAHGAAARRDYDALRQAADREPLPCAVEMQLAKLYAFHPPHVTALSYPAAATTVLAAWLGRHAADAGDQVVGGIDVYSTLLGSDGVRIASCQPPALIDYRDRSAEEVLGTVHKPLQR